MRGRRLGTGWLCLASAGLLSAPVCGLASDADTNSWRVLATHPAYFEYAFTSVVTPADPHPNLAFNHISGRTEFARVGEMIGPYRLVEVQARTQMVFLATLNANRPQVTRFAELEAAGGRRIRLEQGKALPQPGRLASLVKVPSGTRWLVQRGSTLPGPTGTLAVVSITEDAVLVRNGTCTQLVASVSAAERDALYRLWEQAQVAKRERAAAQETEVEPPVRNWAAPGPSKSLVRRPRTTLAVRRPQRMFFGSSYPWPTEFRVLPPVYDRNGQLVRPSVVIPTHFERRDTGISVSVQMGGTTP
jgi:hypothetical protein